MEFAKYISINGDTKKPAWPLLSKAIARMTTGEVKAISIGESETGDTFMIISRCRPTGFYVSARAIGEMDEYDLIDSSSPPDLLECVVGTGRQTITRDALVAVSAIEEVAKHFFLTGERLSTSTWRKTDERYRRIAQGEPIQKIS